MNVIPDLQKWRTDPNLEINWITSKDSSSQRRDLRSPVTPTRRHQPPSLGKDSSAQQRRRKLPITRCWVSSSTASSCSSCLSVSSSVPSRCWRTTSSSPRCPPSPRPSSPSSPSTSSSSSTWSRPSERRTRRSRGRGTRRRSNGGDKQLKYTTSTNLVCEI